MDVDIRHLDHSIEPGSKQDRMFYTESGWLTPYALACGYIEEHNRDNIWTSLWHEGCVYHVRQHDHNEHKRIFWDSFDTLTEARRRYKQAIKK